MKEKARQFLALNAHLANITTGFSFSCISSEQPIGLLGPVDYKPFSGTVFACNADFVGVLREHEEHLVAIDRNCLPNQGENILPGMSISVTPYCRHTFDGRRLDEVEEKLYKHDIIVTQIILIPKIRIPIPEGYKDHYDLAEMVEQLENLSTRGTRHTCTQMLADAGLANPKAPEIIDGPEGCEGLCIRFNVHNQKAHGFFEINLNYAQDLYYARLVSEEGKVLAESEEFYFDQMPEIIEDMVDDGSWAIAQVEILNRAA